MELDLTDAALSDLRAIRDYTLQEWGEQQEEKYLDEMWVKFEAILKDPQRCRFRKDLFPACQLASQGKHVVLFRVEGEVLQVVRVLHSAMDYRRHLSEGL
jgi:toxin ParE1/3/4|tara:strand:- start:3087 stop:3386 length:300 start_codon:yes stop_codon:yes gene_type:complete